MLTSKKNSTLFLFALLALLVTFMGDFVTAAPIGSIDDSSATITCKFFFRYFLIANTLFYLFTDDTFFLLLVAGHTVTVQGIVFSVLLFLTGGYLCFLGGKKERKRKYL